MGRILKRGDAESAEEMLGSGLCVLRASAFLSFANLFIWSLAPGTCWKEGEIVVPRFVRGAQLALQIKQINEGNDKAPGPTKTVADSSWAEGSRYEKPDCEKSGYWCPRSVCLGKNKATRTPTRNVVAVPITGSQGQAILTPEMSLPK